MDAEFRRIEMRKRVFACGCYDLFHVGHLETLNYAASFGDLTVGLSSDEVIKKAKGSDRPIIIQEDRLKIIASYNFVKKIIIGTKKNFVDFIMQEKPDIYVKGGDYNLDTIDQDERRAVESYGGEIKFAKFIEGKSTTKIKDKIKYENE